MFGNKTAWFSKSVPKVNHNFWILEGGMLAGWRTADYLFSDDATCPDTLRVLESKDYLWNKVTIFHSMFLSACQMRQSVKSVFIGHYVLPPAPVQDEVRGVMGRLIWEREDEQPAAQGSSFSHQTEDECSEAEVDRSSCESFNTDTSGNEASTCCDFQDFPASNVLAGYVSMYSLQTYSGGLCDFNLRCFGCSNCKALCFLPNT